MLLLPFRDKSIARSVPVVTAVLVLACTVVLFGFQGKDTARDQAAYSYYHDSGLDNIELPLYQAYLADRNDGVAGERLHLLQGLPPRSLPAAELLQSDSHFLFELHSGRIVLPADPGYAGWLSARNRFDALLGATVHARFALDRADVAEAWRFVTYAFLHGGVAHWLGNMLVLVLVGPFVEAAMGRLRFALAYLAGGAAAGALHVLVSDAPVIGASGAIAATVGMLAVVYGTRRVPVFYWVFFVFGTARIPALTLLPVWLLNEFYQWSQQPHGALSGAAVAYGAHIGGLCAGAVLALLLKHSVEAAAAPARRGSAPAPGAESTAQGSTLATQAQDAAARLDIKRATRLYRELVEMEPKRTDHLGAYLNVALLGADEAAVQDAALRLLWAKFSAPTDELRKTFLQLTQPKVLAALPIDEHLRLARRLVRFREDSAALRVIDAILRDDHLRQLYGRQLADCLLGLFTAYTRHGLSKQAEQISSRLSNYFPTGNQIGGVAPATRPRSTTIATATQATLGRLSLSAPDSALPRQTTRLSQNRFLD